MRGIKPDLTALSKALRICLQFTFIAGAAVTAMLWWILRAWFGDYFGEDPVYYYASVSILTPCGVCTLYILWQLIGLLKTIGQKNPFVRRNARGLQKIAASSFIIALLFVVLLFFHTTVLTAGIAYIFLIAGFCFIVLAGLFRRAVEYKDENDLTV
jgi:hypothetical protein